MQQYPDFQPETTRPRMMLPQNSWDCQVHLYGDPARYPPRNAARAYDPPSTTLEDIERMHTTIGIAHTAIVQATTYGTDHSLLLDTLRATSRDRYVGIGIIDDDVSDRALRELHEAGVRAARFNLWSRLGLAPTTDSFRRSLARIREYGWHAKIHVTAKELLDWREVLLKVEQPCVIDHMGHLKFADGMTQPAFPVVCDLLRRDNWWISLSNGDRNSAHDVGWDDAVPFGRAFYEMAPDRCIWCTDWPHVSYEKAATPDDGTLVDLLYRFLPDEQAASRVLVDNPRRLFGMFPG